MQLVDLRTHNHSTRCCLGLLLVMAMSAGCQKKLFDEKDPRNQFEIHDNLRQDFTPMEVPPPMVFSSEWGAIESLWMM